MYILRSIIFPAALIACCRMVLKATYMNVVSSYHGRLDTAELSRLLECSSITSGIIIDTYTC